MAQLKIRPLIAAAIALWAGRHAATAQTWSEPEVEMIRQVSGSQNGDLFGWLVAALGDVNGDGISDFAAGAPFFDNGGASSSGRIAVHSGATGGLLWSKTFNLTSGILGFTVVRAADLNSDGISDVLAAAPFAANNGTVFLWSGANGALLHTFVAPLGADSFGYSVEGDGDFNGDGTPDIAIGSTSDSVISPSAGRVHVYSGVDFSPITTIFPPGGDKNFGAGLAYIGPIGGADDFGDELAIGARDVANQPAGQVHVYSFDGKFAVLEYTIDNVSMSGSLDSDRVDGGADIDGDGVGDIFIGDIVGDQVWLHSGATGGLIRTHSENGAATYGSGGFLDDIDGDDVPDVGIGARGSNRIFLYSGATGALIRTMTATSGAPSFGADVETIGDVDGDHGPDFLVGASSAGMLASPPGKAFIMRGTPGPQPCAGDVDGDDNVGVNDLLQLLAAWGRCTNCADCPADQDDSCRVTVEDLLVLLSAWGPCES